MSDYKQMTAAEIAEGVKSGKLSAVEIAVGTGPHRRQKTERLHYFM